MKYLNTKYPSLFDSSRFCKTNTTNNTIETSANSWASPSYCTKNINGTLATTSIYVKFLYHSSGGIDDLILNIQTVNGTNLLVKSSSTQLNFTNANGTFSWTVDVPSSQSEIDSSFHKREITVYFNTVENVVSIYSDGIYYGSTSCGNNGENIANILIGSLNAGGGNQYTVQFADIIISENAISTNESITEVTPTITSTDWTVSNGTASTDVVGGSMVLTAPSGSIDETRRSVTGYGLAFFNSTPSETINALNITQGATTKQVIIPSGSVETADTFAVSQLSGISATAVAAYVSQ